jgi:hypothetical protein
MTGISWFAELLASYLTFHEVGSSSWTTNEKPRPSVSASWLVVLGFEVVDLFDGQRKTFFVKSETGKLYSSDDGMGKRHQYAN